MRIYISVDMEGVGGVVRPEQVEKGSPDYPAACAQATDEVIAAIEGLRAGGATDVWVKDAHGRGTNLQWPRLPEHVRLVAGRTRPVRFPGLDASFAALLLIGYHAMDGTEHAVLPHTWMPGARLYFAEQAVGEIAVDAAIAGALGVPVGFVTGDEAACAEARRLLPHVTTVAVKRAASEEGALLFPRDAILADIRAGAQAAVERLAAGGPAPYLPDVPLRFRMEVVGANGNIQRPEARGSDVRGVIQTVLGEA